jgi:hypothetical protein
MFLKAHVKDYTKKDGTVVVAHDDNRPLAARHFAQAAVDYAGRSKDAVFAKDTHETSKLCAGESERAKTPRSHMMAGKLHREAAQQHRNAAHFIKQRGDGNDEDIKHHEKAQEMHQTAASIHEQEAAGKARKSTGHGLVANNYADAAVAVSGRVSEKSAQREQGMKSSAAAGVATKAAQAPREHAAAAKAHDDAAKIHRDAANAGKYDLGLAGAAQDHRAAAQSHEWAAAAHREEAGNVSNDGEAPKPPSFHVTREDEGEQFIDSTHDKFSSAKQRMMDVHHEDPHASPLVHSMPHGILAFPHVDTGKATLTPAYKRAADAAHLDHKEHWADQ